MGDPNKAQREMAKFLKKQNSSELQEIELSGVVDLTGLDQKHSNR